MIAKISKYVTFRNVVILGVIIAFGVTFSEVARDVHRNFKIFSLSTLDFWSDISPYGKQWTRHGLDYFLYAPPFNVIFAPFAYLPPWLGPFVWNIFNFSMFAWAIYLLPKLDIHTKAKILLYLLPIMATSMLSFQYNMAIAYIFLFAFVLLEKGLAIWAMMLIMMSAATKIYGGFELLIVLFYPKIWRNVGWGVLWGTVIIAMPLIKQKPNELIEHYKQWVSVLGVHKDTRTWETFFDIKMIWGTVHPKSQMIIQIAIFTSLTALTIWRLKWSKYFNFRVAVMAVIMGFVILFGNSSEKHTYVIALAGFLYWWYLKKKHNSIDKVLYWSVLAIMVLVPIDLICPPVVMRFVFDDLDLNKWLFTATWIYMVYDTYFVNKKYLS